MPKKQAPFSAEQFTDTQFTSAEDKAKQANALARFCEQGFPREKFTEGLYRTLHVYMSHSAEFNIHGYYHEWFSTTQRQLEWLRYMTTTGVNLLGDPTYTWSDVERAFKSWIKRSGLLTSYQQKHANEVKERELAQLAVLEAKYKPGKK